MRLRKEVFIRHCFGSSSDCVLNRFEISADYERTQFLTKAVSNRSYADSSDGLAPLRGCDGGRGGAPDDGPT